MKHIFIINPIAGKGKIQEKLEKTIHSVLKGKNIHYETYITKYKGDIKGFIQKKCSQGGQNVFYACGGDGTLHETVNSCIGHENALVGVIPCGSGNDFIKNFINNNYFADIESQVNGEAVNLDLMRVNDEYAVTVCNVGFDADAAYNMHKFKNIPLITGSGSYMLSVLYCLSKKLGKSLDVTVDDNYSFSGCFLLGVAANGHSYGGGYKCAPLAEINDGIIDLCFVDNISKLKILSLIKSYKEGTHLVNEKLKAIINYKKCSSVKIKSKEPINVCMDGEIYIWDEIHISIAENALKFWMPKGVEIQNAKTLAI